MEKEVAVNNIQERSLPITSLPTSVAPCVVPVNRGHFSNSDLQPISSSLSLCSSSPLPTSSAVHALQTKVKALTQRRQRVRERGRERAQVDTEVPANQPERQASSQVPPGQRAHGKGKAYLPVHSWRSDAVRNSSSSEEEDEVEVQVRLDIHSPPVGSQGELGNGAEELERREGRFSRASGQHRGIGEGASVENLSGNSSSSKEGPPPPPPLTTPALSSSSSSSPINSASASSSVSSASSSRHWAPPKGFWRVARPETLLLCGPGPHNTPHPLPVKAYSQTAGVAEPQRRPAPTKAEVGSDVGSVGDISEDPLVFKHSDSLECYLDRYEHKEGKTADSVKGMSQSRSLESLSSQSGIVSVDESVEVKQRVGRWSKDRRRQFSREEKEHSGGEGRRSMDSKDTCGFLDNDSDSSILTQEHEPCSSLFVLITDELPLSPRHEQAKRLLERARLKARSNHIKGDPPERRAHSDPRSNTKGRGSNPPPPQEAVVPAKEEAAAPSVSVPLVIRDDSRESSHCDQGSRSRRYGCSPTRVRFEDESEKEAECRYLDRLRERRRPGALKAKSKPENGTDSSSSGSERSRHEISVSVPPSQRREDASGEPTTVIKEIIVLVKKCEACGSIVREPPCLASELQNTKSQQSGNPEDLPCQMVAPPNKPEASVRPKAPLTVTFAGAFVLGENKESGTVWRTSGFGKLRRRSRKGESRLESGHGPYGPSWAQRRNSNPRNRGNVCRAVSFAPGSPVDLEPHLPEASGGPKGSPTPSQPIKSALKSSSKSRTAAGQSSGQVGSEWGGQHLAGLDSSEPRREAPMASMQGTPTTTSLVPCIRPSTLRYSPARLTPDLQAAELWNTTPDGTGLVLGGDSGPGSECRPGLRNLGMSRSEDLRAELLRAEHLKAEAMWEDDISRKSMAERDGRPKLSLRRFFSSIGLNSVGRLVKGGRSSSMEQLSIPTGPRVCSASPSPTRRPQPAIRIQRTPSLQTLHPVLPLAQLRKASSVQSLERRTERSTILGEVQIPYGLAPSPESPQIELHGALSIEEVLPSRVMRPVGRVTQAFPDGTLLLELTKPPNGPYGFVISRGKGRPDTGVYVEKVGDGGGEGPYVGLLGVGDEILQVNGEAVAGLTLDQVTRLMTRDSTASIRIVPRRGQH